MTVNISHRQGDLRSCGASTVVTGQSFVKVNGQLWAVLNDQNTHGDGELINTQSYIKINGLFAILKNDSAAADDLCPTLGGPHCDPVATTGDATVTVHY